MQTSNKRESVCIDVRQRCIKDKKKITRAKKKRPIHQENRPNNTSSG